MDVSVAEAAPSLRDWGLSLDGLVDSSELRSIERASDCAFDLKYGGKSEVSSFTISAFAPSTLTSRTRSSPSLLDLRRFETPLRLCTCCALGSIPS